MPAREAAQYLVSCDFPVPAHKYTAEQETLDLGLNQIISEASFSNCGIQVDSGGTLSTESSYGLYDGTSSASLASTGNMDYFLHASGVIEYTGNGNQILTGTGNGIATSINHQYGILKINKSNE